MPEGKKVLEIVRSLELNVEQKAALGEVMSSSVAVNVYRQLAADAAARGDSGCQIIGNCSSSCSKLVDEVVFG